MILLISNERDITTDYIVLELQRRGVEYFRLNSERLAESEIRWHPALAKNIWEIEVSGRTIRDATVSAAYFRRPAPPVALAVIDDASERRYCEEEWASILRSLYTAIGGRWLNSPAQIAMAEDKPLQLSAATSIGLRIPETLITNSYCAAANFIAEGDTVGKPLHAALLNDPHDEAGRVIFTSRISSTPPLSPDAVKVAPLILQREIPKTSDIRVTVVGDNVFSAAIDSQNRDETTVDWRRGSHPDLPHSCHELPAEIARMCVGIVKLLGLRFAAIDLVLDTNGEYWFLEANPNGQWAWIENRTGLPISSAIVGELLDISARSTCQRMSASE